MTTEGLTLVEVACRAASEAADLVRSARTDMDAGHGVEVDTKSSETDVVTGIDRAAERRIRNTLDELRPGEHVIGEEESGSAVGDTLGGRADSDYSGESGNADDSVTWVVDPIDGTVNFLYGHPSYAISVAAVVRGISVAGAVIEPISHRCWTATRGQGAWLDGRRLRVSAPDRLGTTLLATGFAYVAQRRERQAEMVRKILGSVRDLRRSGSASLDLCALAAGWVDGYCEHGLSQWDWAAGALIAEEAGAWITLPGADEELGRDATFAAAPSIATELRGLLVSCGAGSV